MKNDIDKNKINMAKSISKVLNGEKANQNDLKNVSPEMIEKISDLLKDESKINKLLESNIAQELMKKFGGD